MIAIIQIIILIIIVVLVLNRNNNNNNNDICNISKKKTESSYLLYSLSEWGCVEVLVIFRWDIGGFHRGMTDIDWEGTLGSSSRTDRGVRQDERERHSVPGRVAFRGEARGRGIIVCSPSRSSGLPRSSVDHVRIDEITIDTSVVPPVGDAADSIRQHAIVPGDALPRS